MEKTSKVTKITKMDKKDNYGNTSFIVEFENSDKGFYVSKNENQTTFEVGKDATYLIEAKKGSSGKDYFKITTPQKNSPFMAGKPQQDPKVQLLTFVLAYSKDCYVANINSGNSSFGIDDIFKTADKMLLWIKENSK